MHAVVFEHVSLSDLPAEWRSKLPQKGFSRGSRVTVRIEQEAAVDAPDDKAQADLQTPNTNPMFGMWADREDMANVAAYVRTVRAPRLNADGSPRKS